MRFTALLHHVDVDRLRDAYLALSPKAAAGVDGETWESYGQNLEENLRDLYGRVQRGAYQAKPSRRVYIPKPHGDGVRVLASCSAARVGATQSRCSITGADPSVRGRPIAALDDSYWQSIIDELVRDGKSHSRIATSLAVIRHIYAYARRPNLRVVTNDPTRELEMPANDGKVRERVATADEAAKLIEALPVTGSAGALSWESVTEIRASSQSAVALGRRVGVSDALVGKVRRGELYKTPDGRRSRETGDRVGWGLAFYTGMRRSEIGRAQWPHVFCEADEIMVAKSKSDAGEGRRVPMVGPLKKILREEWMRVGRPETGRIVKRSVLSGKWQARADTAWERAGLARVTLHEARHTYASFLMAAGYNLKQIQEYLGHADLVTTGRYIKNLPVPRGTTAREKLEAYLAAEIGRIEP